MQWVSHEDVFGFEIAMDDLVLLEEIERAEHLLRETSNHLDGKAAERVSLDELVEVHVQEFGRYAEVSTEVETMGKIDHAVFVVWILSERY